MPALTAANTTVRMVNSSVIDCAASELLQGVMTAAGGASVWLEGTPTYGHDAVPPMVARREHGPSFNVDPSKDPDLAAREELPTGVFYSSTPRTVFSHDSEEGWIPATTDVPPLNRLFLLSFLWSREPWFQALTAVCALYVTA